MEDLLNIIIEIIWYCVASSSNINGTYTKDSWWNNHQSWSLEFVGYIRYNITLNYTDTKESYTHGDCNTYDWTSENISIWNYHILYDIA